MSAPTEVLTPVFVSYGIFSVEYFILCAVFLIVIISTLLGVNSKKNEEDK